MSARDRGAERSPRDKPEKKKLQYSQLMTLVTAVFSMVIVFIVHAANFMLLWNGKQSMTQEVLTTINVFGAVTSGLALGGYYVLTGVRDLSVNKHDAEVCKYEILGKDADKETGEGE